MGGLRSTHERDEKCRSIKNFGRKMWRDETIQDYEVRVVSETSRNIRRGNLM
jgi:hypothetical protein